MVSIWGFFNVRDLVKLCTTVEMSVCGPLVRLEWSRLVIFKEVTTTVWQLMARFFVVFFLFLAENKTKYIKIHLKIPKQNKQKKQECQFFLCIPDAHMRALCVCVFGDEASGWKVLQYGLRSIFTKAFYRWEH